MLDLSKLPQFNAKSSQELYRMSTIPTTMLYFNQCIENLLQLQG